MFVCFVTLSTPKPSRLHALIQRSDFSRSMCGFGNGTNVTPFVLQFFPVDKRSLL